MKKNITNQKGFSLIELLVVVIIIAIIAAIAIPNLLASRRAANEASAASSLRTIHSAQATYQATAGGGTQYASTLVLLGPGVGNAAIIDGALAAASATPGKSGYVFTLSTNGASNTIYCTAAAPDSSTTGTRTFGVASDGVLYGSNATNSNATACALGVLTGGAVLQ